MIASRGFPLKESDLRAILNRLNDSPFNGTALTSLDHAKNIFGRLDWKLVAVLALFLAVSFTALNDVFVYIPDSARYLVWAESLSHFQGLTDASGPDPISYVIHAPLYSFLLVPASFLGGVVAAKILTILFGLALLILIYFYLYESAGTTQAAIGIAFLALNPLQILYSTQVLSDVPFALFFVLILIMIDRVVLRSLRLNGLLIGLAVLMSAAMLLREVGIALVLACGLLFLVRKEYPRAAVMIIVPLALYAFWFLRNEVAVAGLEHPPLRNSDLFTAHLYTVREAPLLEEFLARVSSNVRIYGELAGKLLFLTQYDLRGYGIIPPGESAFGWILKNGRLLVWPVSILTIGLSVLGLWHEWKRRESMRMVLYFLIFYVPLILIYPFNDIRFLFPLLIILLLSSVIGATAGVKALLGGNLPRRATHAAVGLCLFLLAVPNSAWVWSFVNHNARYGSDPERYFQSMALRPDAPELLLAPMSRIGEWLNRNTEADAVIATRWKQLSFWLGGRKLLELNPMLPVDQFENQMRDYRVGYLVALVDRSRLREFETQMALSSRFSFTPVQRIGNAVIIKVHSSRGTFSDEDIPVIGFGEDLLLDSLNRSDAQFQYLFRSALLSMDAGMPEDAEETFQSLSTKAGRSGTVVLYTAIARSLGEKFEEAEILLHNVREAQQAGPLLIHSWYHLQIIEKLRKAYAAPDSSVRADLLTKVAGDYWSLGFRKHAGRILEKAMSSDAGFAPALVFGIYFDLQRKDTVSAKKRLGQLRSIDISYPAVVRFGELIASAETATKEKDVVASLISREAVARRYMDLNLTESAIDELVDILALDPDRLSALRTLAAIYVERERYAPAMSILDRISAIDPQDPALKDMRERLSSRWGD